MSVKMTALPNGIRVISDTIPAVETVAIGIWVLAGTRYEDMEDNGVAHMVEHMVFKGTPTRTAQQIAEQVEDAGGNMNAYTSREVTSYHVHLLKEDAGLAFDIIADMLQDATMPEEEVERERHVILQEIGMSNDTPDDLVFDLFQDVNYPGQALGAPILGTSEIISAMKRETLYEYLHKHYTPGRIVVAAAGNIEHDYLVGLAAKALDNLKADSTIVRAPAAYKGGEVRQDKALEQSHLVMGFRGVPRTDAAYYSCMALSTLLGGGLSSRLFQEVREKRGLVYSIYSFQSSYHDDGQFGIYAGTGPKDLRELVPVVCDEVKKVCGDVTEQEISRAKAQLKAGFLMGRESMMTRADQMAKHLMYCGRVLDVPFILGRIDSVTVDSVQDIARKIFATPLTLAGLGPMGDLESYDRITGRLA